MEDREYAPPELLSRARAGDRGAAAELAERNDGLIRSIARRFEPRLSGHAADGGDLYQIALVGFLKAVKGFDGSFGTRFSTYAVPKIAGEIRRFLRDDGMIKVARSLKEASGELGAARTRLLQSLGREPTVSELSEATGLEPEEVAACETACAPVDSLERPLSEDGAALGELLPAAGEEESGLLERLSLETALSRLDERSALLIRLRFYASYTQQRTAERLGVSQVQVSRLEARALARLREMIAE